ncbi:hypothetical protein CHLRE_08g363450v5 [Chlamydomonas reinhardtii]|uniref:SAP domain-containing protein n=1 Tax=Chlamydomonas reinhardtii TaxID=3055 RepID=A0A2K3DGN3_CHLRE|nr:uncharacterized protein CHLRE_08g363450v5 [Chlamydomonas reinhardtii]PNW79700.1 hypothetical protein CHLRE_08g363450v5 [Chlamydomonas reinhardtii]
MARQKRQRASTTPEDGADLAAEAPPAKVLRRSARVRSITEAAEAKTATVSPAVPAVKEEPEGDDHEEELLPPQQQQRQPGAVAQQQGGPLTQEPQPRQTRAAAAATPSPMVKSEPAASQEPATQEADQQDSEVASEPEPEESEPESEEPPSPKKPATGQKGKKAAKKAAKPKKERKKKTPTRRICLSAAMAQYGLSRKEMDALTDVHLEPNPHHARGAPMRLYLAHQVAELAAKKQERLRYEADHADEIAAAREEEARQRREAAKQAAALRAREAKLAAQAKVAPLRRQSIGDSVPAGATPLPQELWAVVFQRLAATLEPQGGVRGPSVVAEDIVRAGLACRDMFIASRAGLEALAEEVVAKRHLDMQRPPLPVAAPVVDWARWDKALRTPLDCLVPELKSACKDVGTTCSGTKAELVVRLMNHFGLPDGRRCPVSAKLWVALRQEHAQYGHHNGVLTPLLGSALRDLLEVGDAAAARALQYGSLSAFRRRVAAAYGDTAGVMAAHLACLPRLGEIRAERARRAEEERRASEERRRQQYELWQREAEARRGRPQVAANGQLMCACGQMVSAACSLRLCGGCCKRAAKAVPCPKHG